MESSRETHKRIIAQRVTAVLEDAARLGLVVTVVQVPALPLSMGHHTTTVAIRDDLPSRKIAEEIEKRRLEALEKLKAAAE